MDTAKGIAQGFVRKMASGLGMDTGKGSGHVHLEVIGADGAVKEVRDHDNLYVDAGNLSVVERTGGVDATAAFDWIAVGTSTQAIFEGASQLLDDPSEHKKTASAPNPFGDGRASQRIVDFLSRL